MLLSLLLILKIFFRKLTPFEVNFTILLMLTKSDILVLKTLKTLYKTIHDFLVSELKVIIAMQFFKKMSLMRFTMLL